jgi:uncharacterized membrane protein
LDFADVMEGVTRGFEILGVGVFIVGSAWAFVTMIIGLAKSRALEGFKNLRRSLGRVIILGLEILIIADIIQTITVDLTWEGVLGLALIVFVRTFLSFALEIELDGVAPWRRAEWERRRKTDAETKDTGRDEGTDRETGGDRS